MYRNKTARQHNFATVPRSDIPRSRFAMRQTRKQAFNASDLVPIMCEEVLPGDTWAHTESIMARLATPIAPVLDDLDLETWYFFVPNRILDPDWEDLITGVDDTLVVPTITPLSTDVVTPRVVRVNSVFDHFGIPIGDFTTGPLLEVTAYPIWGYFKIWNEWFRDQNLQAEYEGFPWVGRDNSTAIVNNIGPWNEDCIRVNKRHDYFTSSLPWPQKGDPVSLPLGSTAPVVPITPGTSFPSFTEDGGVAGFTIGMQNAISDASWYDTGSPYFPKAGTGQKRAIWLNSGLEVDLALATAATINDIRLASTIQKLLERDARGGSRYVENILAHWGVRAPNYMLQRPEYLGGSKIPITVNPIAQTAAYDAEPGPEASAVGNLGAEMHASGHKRTFTYAAVEHGYIIGLCAVRATPTYQQGMRRHWRRRTRLDFWDPLFAGLGEQAVATEEIYQPFTGAGPITATWGYQERGAEYRYTPNEITGVLRSTATEPLDWWHYSEEFAAEPALNRVFIEDVTQETLARSLATAPSEQWSAQIIMDIQHDSTVARLMPTYSVPGISHF